MWNLWIIEYDNKLDPETGKPLMEEVEKFHISSIEELGNFLLNIRKDMNRNPEFFCPACGFWTSYKLVLKDKKENIVCIRSLYELFLEEDEVKWNFDSLTISQLQEILAYGF